MSKSGGNLRFSGVKPLKKLGEHAKFLAYANPLYALTLQTSTYSRLIHNAPDVWAGNIERGQALMQGSYDFFGETVQSNSIPWEPIGVSDEWLDKIHSFEWLRDIRAVGSDDARRYARYAIDLWISEYSLWNRVSWKPETIAKRLSAWISFYSFFGSSADDEFQEELFISVQKQVKHLCRIKIKELSGMDKIHLAKSFIYFGVCFEGEEDYIEQGLNLLISELSEQILEDGGHVSRNPENILYILKELIDIRAVLNLVDYDIPYELQKSILSMAQALRLFRHCDGGLAVFNGGQENNSSICDAVLNQINHPRKAYDSLKNTGFERLSNSRTAIIFDTGKSHNSNYKDTQHAGMFGFELSSGRERFIVNCGSYPAGGTWQEVLKSTAAHSGLIIDNKNNKDLNSFVEPEINIERISNKEIKSIKAKHNGYFKDYNINHKREISLTQSSDIINGRDILEGVKDVPFALRFHLHPNIQASIIRDGKEVLFRGRSGMGWRLSIQNHDLSLEESVYIGHGLDVRKTQQIVLNSKTTGGQTILNWQIVREKM